MKKLTKKQEKIFEIISIIVLSITLFIVTYSVINKVIKRKEITVQAKPDVVESAKEKEENEEIQVILNNNKEEKTEKKEEENKQVKKKEEKNQNKATNNSTIKPASSSNYYIKVNYGANVVTIYTKDENGEYTVPYKAMICSTGTSTPRSGIYKIPAKCSTWQSLFGNVYGQYATQITGNILFHSVPYTKKYDNSSLEYWEYDKLRTSSFNGMYKVKGL